jgi:hypothetical protein
MGRLLPLLTGAAVVLGAGLFDGAVTHRWWPDTRLQKAVACLDRVPAAVGDWQGADEEVNAVDLRSAHIDAFVCRRYVNERTREAVLVLLVCGQPGPIAVHTPDVCYAAAGYKMDGNPVVLTLPAAHRGPQAKADVFRAARLRNPSPVPTGTLRVCWSWFADGVWQAPDNPRLAFARHGALYKLYVLREQRATERDRADDDTAKAFLQAFLPKLDEALRTNP